MDFERLVLMLNVMLQKSNFNVFPIHLATGSRSSLKGSSALLETYLLNTICLVREGKETKGINEDLDTAISDLKCWFLQ